MDLTEKQINTLIYDTVDVGDRVKHSYNLVMSMKDHELQVHYTKELLEMIRIYEEMCGILRKQLEDYTKFTSESNQPINFVYKKILKSLKNS